MPCDASFPIASFARRSDCEMCHEKGAGDRVDHGDSVHRVSVGNGSRSSACRVHGSIGDRQHERVGRNVMRGRCRYWLAARDLAQEPDWDAVLSGSKPSSFTDGAAGGAHALPGGGSIDLTVATNMLNCGKSSNCTAAQLTANSHERPWGANNPRWQLYAYGPIELMAPLLRPAPGYLAVWVADDGREQDGGPGRMRQTGSQARRL